MWQDLRLAVRGFRKTPLFTLVALVTLTLAIGANTAIFGLLNALLLRDAAVRDPQSLVQVSSVNPQNGSESGLTYALYHDLQQRQQVFATVLGWNANGVFNLVSDGQTTRGMVSAVSGNFYGDLGVRPVAGRLITADDLREPSEDPAMVAVLGHTFWRRTFGGDVNVVGRRVVVEATPFTIIGVAPPDFIGLGLFVEPDVTVPLTAYPKFVTFTSAALRTGTSNWVRVTGRLKPGLTLAQAEAAIGAFWPDLKAANVPPSFEGARRDRFLAMRLSLRSAAKGLEPGPGMRARFTRPLYALLAIALLVLLIACVNLASLMVARGAMRSHEVGVRLALGAARFRVMRPMLAEGLLLSAGGAACGALLAFWASDTLASVILRDYSVRATLDVTPDGRVLAFTATLATLVGLLFSSVPAWRAGRQDVTASLRQSTRTSSGGGRTGRLLVAVQVGLSLILLVNAGLLVRSLQQVRAVSSGMRAQDVFVTFPQALPGGYKGVDNDTYYPNVVARLESVPGIQRAAISNFKPAGGGIGGGEQVSSVTSPPDAGGVRSNFMSVSPQLFDTLGMAMKAGRDFSWNDHSRSRAVAIVSATLAERLFPDGSAIGQRVRTGVLPRRQDLEIVGIVADAHIYDLKDPNLASIYVPSLQEPDLVDGKCFVIRGAGVPFADLKEAVAAFGYETIQSSQSLEYIVDRVLLQDRLTAVFAAFFGAVALLLAAIGLYGLMSFEVAQRRREIAIRVALGAEPTRVVTTVVRDGLIVTLTGLVIGGLAALASVRLVSSLIFGVTTQDPVTLAGAPALLFAIAALASLLPAVRAGRTDPMTTLRGD